MWENEYERYVDETSQDFFFDAADFSVDSAVKPRYILFPETVSTSWTSKISVQNSGATDINIDGLFARWGTLNGATLYLNDKVYSHDALADEIADNPILVLSMKLTSNPTSVAQNLSVQLKHQNMMGNGQFDLFNTSTYFNEYQYQQGIVNVPISFILNGYVGLSFTLPANSKIDFTLFIRARQRNDRDVKIYYDRVILSEVKRAKLDINRQRQIQTSTK